MNSLINCYNNVVFLSRYGSRGNWVSRTFVYILIETRRILYHRPAAEWIMLGQWSHSHSTPPTVSSFAPGFVGEPEREVENTHRTRPSALPERVRIIVSSSEPRWGRFHMITLGGIRLGSRNHFNRRNDIAIRVRTHSLPRSVLSRHRMHDGLLRVRTFLWARAKKKK